MSWCCSKNKYNYVFVLKTVHFVCQTATAGIQLVLSTQGWYVFQDFLPWMEAMVWPRSNQLREKESKKKNKKKSEARNSIPLFTAVAAGVYKPPPQKKEASLLFFSPLLQLVASLLPRNWFSPRIAVSTEMELPLLSFNARVDCECATICRGDAAARSAAVAMVWWILARAGRRFPWPPRSMMEREEPASSWGSLKQFRLYSRLD